MTSTARRRLPRSAAPSPPADIEAIETEIREELEAQHSGAKIFSGWIRQRADRAIAEKHGVLPFEEWQKRSG
jgi:hypothetical protein